MVAVVNKLPETGTILLISIALGCIILFSCRWRDQPCRCHRRHLRMLRPSRRYKRRHRRGPEARLLVDMAPVVLSCRGPNVKVNSIIIIHLTASHDPFFECELAEPTLKDSLVEPVDFFLDFFNVDLTGCSCPCCIRCACCACCAALCMNIC